MPPVTDHPRWTYAVFCGAMAACVAVMIMHAWVAEDAFITFRVVDNFVHGYGLRWNIDERVQAYTNPLWMLLHIPFYWIWPHIAFIDNALSFSCFVASLAIMLRTVRATPLQATVYLLLPLSFSKTLTAYFSSGLENPLTSLLFACFATTLRRTEGPHRLFMLTLIVALSMFNRLDTVVAYLPAMLWLLWSERRDFPWRRFIAGVLPILGWLSFSLFYYGFLFPNTKYAKLDGGIDEAQYLAAGIRYLAEFVFADPVMAAIIMIVIGHGILRMRRFAHGLADRADTTLLMLTLGMIAYCTYVVVVGGNHISCRFLSLPAFIALWVFFAGLPPWTRSFQPLVAASLVIALLYASTTILTWSTTREWLAQAYSVFPTGDAYYLFVPTKNGDLRVNTFDHSPDSCERAGYRRIELAVKSGHLGYYGGPCLHIIDQSGLSDALLARLPANSPILGRAGHLGRDVPQGYEHALRTGALDQMDLALAQYYQPLRLIIEGNLWSWERLRTIGLFNLGAYDHWRDEYLQQGRVQLIE